MTLAKASGKIIVPFVFLYKFPGKLFSAEFFSCLRMLLQFLQSQEWDAFSDFTPHQGKHECLSGVHTCLAAPIPRLCVSALRAVCSEHAASKHLAVLRITQRDAPYSLKCPPKGY